MPWLLAYLVVRVTLAARPWMQASLWPWLGAAGRNSLQVFCAGLFLSYGAALALRLRPGWAP